MPSMTPVAASSGTAVTAVDNLAPLYCSDVDLVCSDDLACSEDGAVAAAPSTGAMVPA